jgi:hypothetical protein
MTITPARYISRDGKMPPGLLANLREPMKILGRAIMATTALALLAGSCFADEGRAAGGSPGDERNLVQIQRYIVELTALKRNLLNRANIEQIVHGTFLPTGRRYEQDFTIDDGFGINFLFVEHSDHELLEIEFRPLLPMPKIIDQQSLADYQKRFEEYAPIALKRHCIAQADIAMSLHESGWTWFPTELSTSPDDKSGNVVYFSEDKGFVILTLEDSCLAAIQISTERSYSGTYGKAIVH